MDDDGDDDGKRAIETNLKMCRNMGGKSASNRDE